MYTGNASKVKRFKIANCFILVIVMILFSNLYISSSAESYSEKTVTVDYDGQIVDSFCGVDANYVTYPSDTGEYSCAGYVSKFYREIFGVTVYNINIIDDKPSVYVYGKNAELREVSIPQPGDIMQDKDYSHVAIVKDCKDGEVTLIEQNYKWKYNAETYTVVNRKVLQSRHYFYRLYIDGQEQSINADTTPPEISSMNYSKVDSKSFSVSAKLKDNVKVDRVKVSVYTQTSEQKDIKWETFFNVSDDFSYTVYTKDFNDKKDNYIVTFYAYDQAGNFTLKSVSVNMGQQAKALVTLDKTEIKIKKGDSAAVKATVSGSGSLEEVSFKSLDEKIASVDSSGRISAKAVGKTVVTACVEGGKKAECEVTVTDDISNAKIGKIANQTYTAGEIKPVAAVKYNGVSLNLGEDYTVKYKNCINVGTAEAIISGKGYYTGEVKVNYKIVPGEISSVQVKVSSNTAKISWSAAKGAYKYALQRYNYSKSVWETLTLTKSLSYTDNDLQPGKTYKYRVKGYKTVNGVHCGGKYTSPAAGVTAPSKVQISANCEKSGSAEVSWDCVSGAAGYEIFISSDGSKDSFVKIGNTKKTSFTVKDLPSFSLRFIKVRAYRTSNEITAYGDFSAAAMVMIK